jgi:hypothetical protein
MNIDKNSPYFSKVFLDLIQDDAKFKDDFQASFPELYADIDSYKNNPNCSCRNKIETFVTNNRDRSFIFIEGWLAANKHLNLDFNDIIKKYFTTQAAGSVYRISKSEEAFKFFYQKVIDGIICLWAIYLYIYPINLKKPVL